MESFSPIEKEAITTLQFPKEEVLTDDHEIKQRAIDLQRAMALGNLDHIKMKIYFEDNEQKRVVDTTIWAVTDHKIILKQGTVIPIHRIHKLV
ncbi:MAG: hypothetical protein ACOVLC_02985 [Flavobacterium sp.]|jgi:hypothetical protein